MASYLRACLPSPQTNFKPQYNIMQNIPATQRIEAIKTKHPRWCVYRVVWRAKYAPRMIVMLSARMADKLQHGHATSQRFSITFVGRTGITQKNV
jgi:hypothetical protein